MSIGIVTWYGVTNYGSALQAYALQRMMAQAGHESVILRHAVHESLPDARRRSNLTQRFRRLRQLTPGRRAAVRGEREKIEAVAAFRSEHLSISDRYLDECEVDLAIIGSDQIFDIRNFHPFQFGLGLAARRIATYAPSFGETTLDDLNRSEHRDTVRDAVATMTFVSARDENSRTILEALTGREIDVVLDPTLVYDFAEEDTSWDVDLPKGRYVAVYAWGGSTTTREFADAVRSFARKHALKTVSIGDTRTWCDHNFAAASPQEFFGLISKAAVVVTNMFHGSCFSIRNGVPLIPIVMPHNANKLGDLLLRLGLEAHRVDDLQQIAEAGLPEIDYETTGTLLDQARTSSRAHLVAALNGQIRAA